MSLDSNVRKKFKQKTPQFIEIYKIQVIKRKDFNLRLQRAIPILAKPNFKNAKVVGFVTAVTDSIRIAATRPSAELRLESLFIDLSE